MFKKILILLAVIVVVFVGVVAMQPSSFHVERTAVMAAPPADVFAQVNDFHNWQAWSPWAKMDPEAKNSFEGPSSGKGAIFKWSGNFEVGAGTMTLVESKPDELIRIRLDFEKPMRGTNVAEFTFKPEAGQTRVTWSNSGDKNIVCKGMCLFMDMNKMIGDQFDQGLANIKAIVEKKAVARN